MTILNTGFDATKGYRGSGQDFEWQKIGSRELAEERMRMEMQFYIPAEYRGWPHMIIIRTPPYWAAAAGQGYVNWRYRP